MRREKENIEEKGKVGRKQDNEVDEESKESLEGSWFCWGFKHQMIDCTVGVCMSVSRVLAVMFVQVNTSKLDPYNLNYMIIF